MHGPGAVGWLLVALCAVTGVSCLLRARGASGPRRRAAGSEAVMGFGMAAMALPPAVLGPLPPALLTVAFGTLFAALAAVEVALWRMASGHTSSEHPGGHHVHHAVGAMAMVYMTLAMAMAPAGPSGHHGAAEGHNGPAGFGPLTGALLVYFAGYVLALGLQLVPSPAAGATPSAAGAGDGAGAAAERGARAAGTAHMTTAVAPAGGTGAVGTAVQPPGRVPGVSGEPPALAAACRLAMGTGMLAMLLTM